MSPQMGASAGHLGSGFPAHRQICRHGGPGLIEAGSTAARRHPRAWWGKQRPGRRGEDCGHAGAGASPRRRHELVGEDGQSVVADLGLLAQVAQHKATFFRSGWASYETARPGTFRLMPGDARVKDLRADYRAMVPMMFDQTPPSFEEILAKSTALEEAINS